MFDWEDFGENEKRRGKYERKWVEEVLGWKRKGERKMLGPAILSLGPPKLLLSPNWGENEGEKGERVFWTKLSFFNNFLFFGFFLVFQFLLFVLLVGFGLWFFMFYLFGVLISLLVFFFFFLFPFNLF